MEMHTFGKQLVCLCDLTCEIVRIVVLRSQVFWIVLASSRICENTARRTHLLSFFRADDISCGYRVSRLHPGLGRMKGPQRCPGARTQPYLPKTEARASQYIGATRFGQIRTNTRSQHVFAAPHLEADHHVSTRDRRKYTPQRSAACS